VDTEPPRALLLTGPPGVGKTTVLRRAAGELADLAIRGFTTDEIREAGERRGFRIVAFGGRTGVLAHVDVRSPHRVSRYGVDLAALEGILEEEFPPGRAEIVFLDEIGRMECLSSRFVETVESLLGSARVFVATVALRGGGFIEEVKRRPDVLLWTVSRANRTEMPARVAEWVQQKLDG
jgi:nucleoside-triphosphatase